MITNEVLGLLIILPIIGAACYGMLRYLNQGIDDHLVVDKLAELSSKEIRDSVRQIFDKIDAEHNKYVRFWNIIHITSFIVILIIAIVR